MKIRNSINADAEAILALHSDIVNRVNALDYSAEQIAAWLDKQRLDRAHRLIASGKIIVAVDEADQIIGFTTRHEDKIHGMYVSADHLRQGIASALYARLESDARRENQKHLVAESSLAAVPFYHSMGFKEVESKQWSLSGAISMEVVIMRKEI